MATVESLNLDENSGDIGSPALDSPSNTSDKDRGGEDVESKTKSGENSDEEGEASDDGEIPTNGKNGDKEEGELEEGEVDDEEEGEDGEKKEICKYFFKGQCTWGANCRFIHVSSTDKGNYNMFEELKKAKDEVKPAVKAPRTRSPPGIGVIPGMKVRLPMIPPDFFPPIPEPPRRESAWERSTRQAKHLAQSAAKKRDALEDNLHGFVDAEVESEFFNEDKPSAHRQAPRNFMPFNRQEFEAMMNRDRRNNQPTFFSRNFDRRRESPPQMDSRRNIQNNRQRFDNNNSNNRQRNADEWQDPWMRSRSPGRKRDNWQQRKASASPVSRSRSRSPSGSDKVSRTSRSNGSGVRNKRMRRSVSGKRARSPSGSPISSKSSRSSASKSPPPEPVEKRRSHTSSREPQNGKRKRSSGQRSVEREPVEYNRNESTQSPSLSNVSDSEDGPRTPPPDDADEEAMSQQERDRPRRNRSPSPVSPEGDQNSHPSAFADNLADEAFNKKQKKTHKPIKLTLQAHKNERRAAASSAFRGYDDEEMDDAPESPRTPQNSQSSATKARDSPDVDKDRTSPLSDEDSSQKQQKPTPLAEEKAQKREELLRQLRAVEEAIARKKATKAE